MYDENDIARAATGMIGQAALANKTTQRERLQYVLQDSERRQKVAREALDILERNPDLERLLDLLSKI